MEQVTHAVDKNAARFTPFERLAQTFGVQREIETVWKIRVETFGYCFGIAEFTAGGDFVAARSRIPCFVRPLNCCACARHAPPA